MKASILGIAAAGLLVVSTAHAGGGDPSIRRTTYLQSQGKEGIGSQYREDLAVAGKAIHVDNDLPRARTILLRIAAFCEALARPGMRLVAAQDDAQYERFIADHPTGEPTQFVDMTCADAFKNLAFIDIETGDRDAAMRRLDQSIALAPAWADPHAEKGFLLGQLGRHEDALAEYRTALALADGSSLGDGFKALAWRGTGYMLIELQRWDEARAAYDRSLELEPGNALAKEELEFIAKSAPIPEAQATTEPVPGE
ncbi:MAG: tetratricopeptide repeat protein [Lysobacter sp.]|nr:tetratricopeptide repeat protein [Lysobacter sp.]